MEHKPIKYIGDDLEEGQLSDNSDGSYTPLQRPTLPPNKNKVITQPSDTIMENISDTDDFASGKSSDSSDSDFDGNPKKMKSKKTLAVKPKEMHIQHYNKRKNNIWSERLEEESLMEHLKGCDVTHNEMRNRNVEYYDVSIKYRLKGEKLNGLKRRQSCSDDQESHNSFESKRFCSTNTKRNHIRCDEDSKSNDNIQLNREVIDLATDVNNTDEEIANDIANKLLEEKDDLILRVVKILGKDMSIKLFKKTQNIESKGGMLIQNGNRRRTPGGLFLFLLKQEKDITKEERNLIFIDDKKAINNEKKIAQARNRDKKVEELKKTLNLQASDNDLPTLSTRKELAVMAHLKPETHSTMSNPPPSPVTDCNRENSSDFDTNNIQHVNITTPEKDQPKEIASYEDDFLDMHFDDMDLF